jgi:cytochrome c oxidase cbb3-type subunit 1
MYGFVTFAVWGGIYALLPAATGKYASGLGLALHFWMALVGSFIYIISLSIGGTFQGLDWVRGAPFIQSVVDMQQYYVWRGVGGLLMFLSHLVFGWNVWKMTFAGNAVPAQQPPGEKHAA